MNESQPVSEKRPGRIKRLGMIAGAGLTLLVALFLFATSGLFVRTFVLPRLGNALNAKVTVTDASVGLFSGVSLSGLHVEAGGESLVKTESARLRYSFMDLLSGRVRVGEFTLVKPEVLVVVRADGSSNLDPITHGMQSAGEETETQPDSGAKVDLAINNIVLKDARFRFEQFTDTGLRNVFEAAEVNIEVDRFGSGLEGSLKMSTRLLHESGVLNLAPTNRLSAAVAAAFKFAFDASLMPTAVTGSGRLDVNEAKGSLVDVDRLAGNLEVDLSAEEVRSLTLDFKQGGEDLGRVSVSGPFNAGTMAARLKLEVAGIGGSVLNLAGAPMGLNFGETTVNTRHEITVSDGARSVAASGKVMIEKFSVTMPERVTPVMNLHLDYAMGWDQMTKTLDLGRFLMAGADADGEFLKAKLSEPCKLALGEGGLAGGSAVAFDFALDKLDLAKWSSASGGLVETGVLNGTMSVRGSTDGKELEINLAETVRGLATRLGTNRIDGIDTDAAIKLKLTDMKRLVVDTLRVGVARGGRRMLTLNSAGEVELTRQDANLGVSLVVDLPVAADLAPAPDVRLTGGTFSFAGRVTATNRSQAINGKITLAALTGVLAGQSLDRFGLDTILSAERAPDGGLSLSEWKGDLSLAGRPVGRVNLSGRFDPATTKGRAKLAVTGVNQDLLRPLVEPALGGARLAAAGLAVSLEADYGGGANGAVRGSIDLSELVLDDPQGRYPATPIGVSLALDGKASEGKEGLSILLPLLRGTMKVGGRDAGRFDGTADYDSVRRSGKVHLSLVGINEQLVAPFAAAALGDKTLRSVAVDARLDGTIDLGRSSSLRGGFAVTNLVVVDPAGKIPGRPLAVEVGIDAGMAEQKLDLRALTLTLAATEKARNVLTTSGSLDFSDTNALAANLKVTSEALDLTPYFDLLSGGGATEPDAAPPASVPPPPASDSNVEPTPVTLPVRNSRVDVQIGKLHLREIEVSDVMIAAVIDRQTIAVSPLRIAVNGGPVNGSMNLNLGLPGHQYDLRLNVDRVPIRPALQSFSPTIGATSRGDLVADLLVKGVGQTGRSLREHLNGNIGFHLTNAMLTILPENKPQPPSTGLGATLRSVGSEFASSGLKLIADVLRIPDLTSSPVTHLAARVEMGQGSILLKNADVSSDKFMVHAEGVIPIADVLTNSPLSIPVDMWLSRSAANRLSLTGGEEPFTKLPRFIEMRGTLGTPQTHVNKAALGTVLLGGAAGLLKGVGGDVGKAAEGIVKQGGGEVGNLLKGIGGLLGGGKQSTTNAPAKTNAPGTDVKKLFRLPF